MPGLVALVNAISLDVVAKIAAAGLPPLVDGQIVISRSRVAENTAPPRIVFVPTSFRFGPRAAAVNTQPINPNNPNAPGFSIRSILMTQYGGGYSAGTTVTISVPDVGTGVRATATPIVSSTGAVVRIALTNQGSGYLRPPTITVTGAGANALATANLTPTPTAMVVLQQRPIYTEFTTFQVSVWGCASNGTVLTPDYGADFDATQQYYHQVIASLQATAANLFTASSGVWLDSLETATTVDLFGHKIEFSLEIQTPVLSEPMIPLVGSSTQYAPSTTQVNPTNYLNNSQGTNPETG